MAWCNQQHPTDTQILGTCFRHEPGVQRHEQVKRLWIEVKVCGVVGVDELNRCGWGPTLPFDDVANALDVFEESGCTPIHVLHTSLTRRRTTQRHQHTTRDTGPQNRQQPLRQRRTVAFGCLCGCPASATTSGFVTPCTECRDPPIWAHMGPLPAERIAGYGRPVSDQGASDEAHDA